MKNTFGLNSAFYLAVICILLLVPESESWRRRRRRRSPPPPPPNTPPTFNSCSSPGTQTAYATSRTVTWTVPTASDTVGTPSVTREGPASGSTFTEGSHRITYTARDSGGLSATCVISFTVVVVRCSSIGSSPHRSVSCSNSFIANSVCRFRCSTGYDVSGTSPVTCLTSGSWNTGFPTCRIRTCGPPPAISHGSMSCPNYNFGSRCSFSCNSGYTISGGPLVCGPLGTWTGTTPACEDTQPPSFSMCPNNIVVNNDDRTTSAVVSYATPRAADNSGSAPSVAKTTGLNSGSTFPAGNHAVQYRATDGDGNHADCSFSITVNVVSCSSIPTQNGRIPTCAHGTLKGATCSFACDIGYSLSGPATTTCGSDGDWNRGFPNCIVVSCPQLSAPHGGSMASCQRSYGSTCTFSCSTGHELVGSASRRCSHQIGGSSGFWTGTPTTCRIRTCPFPTVSGGLIDVYRSTCQVNSDTTVNYGGVCEYACRPGYHLPGSGLRTCGASGSWTSSLPACSAITCPLSELPAPANGVRTRCSGTSADYGDTCVLSCNRGYRPTEPTERTCQDNSQGRGVWSAGTITCSMVTCSPLSPPSHGQVVSCSRGGSSVPVTQAQGFDSTCTVRCNSGYTLTSGSPTRTCLVSGQWDGQDAVCTDETPPSFPCPDVTEQVYAEPTQVTASPTWNWEPLRASDASGEITAVLTSVDGGTVSGRPASFSEGSHTLLYTATDSSGNSATCTLDLQVYVVRCANIEASPHAAITGCSTPSSTIRGTVCNFQCDSGYERLSGDVERTCTQDSSDPSGGYWSGTQLQCSAVQCALPPIPHGSITGCSGGAVSFQETCQFSCDVGYRTPAGNSERARTCQADRNFSGQDFDCSVQVTCPGLPSISRGSYSPASCTSGSPLPYGTVCSVVCETGFDPAGPLTVNCLDSGSWSDTRESSCIDVENPVFGVTCPVSQIELADRGVLSWTGTIEAPAATDNSGDVVIRRVDGSPVASTAYLEGVTSVGFEAADSSGNVALCTVTLDVKVKRCSHLPQPEGGAVQQCTNHYGSTCIIVCNNGYQLSGSASRSCELDASGLPFWSGTDTVCTIRRCPVVEPPLNALPSNCGGSPGNLVTFGSVCSFYCPHGYTPEGESTVNCQADGTWSEASFECQAITCPPLNMDGIDVSPPECLAAPQYGQQCIFSCSRTGYSVQPISSIQVTCTGGGFWSGDIDQLRCQDTTLPVFSTCPNLLTFYTDPSTHTAPASWSVTATDNDGNTPAITCDPAAGSELIPGDYIVTCTATDGAGNQRRCVFDVQVRDRRCSALYPPVFGSFVGSCSATEGSACTVTCDDGYRLVGSPVAVCETVGGATIWTREVEPQCDVITCDSLESFDPHGRVEPFFCRSPNEPYAGSRCDIQCTDQYTLDTTPTEAPSTVECLGSGSWSYDVQETYACTDDLPPTIYYCPPPIRATRSDISQPVTIYFDLPLAGDNSGEDIQPVLTPSLGSPHDFEADTTIDCLFSDSAGNVNDMCSIQVVIVDDVAPVLVEPCPASFEITTGEQRTILTWEEPRFEDPGGKHVIVSSNYRPGDKFTIGTYTVRYTGINQITGRQSECSFTVQVNLQSCAPLNAPANGALACHESADGQLCTLSCLPGYAASSATFFICDSAGKWQPRRSANCGSRSRPRRSTVPVSTEYATDDCSKAGEASAVAEAFLEQLLATQFADICAGQGGCSVDDIRVTCGPVSSRRKGRGRDRGRRLARIERQTDESEDLAWTFEIDLAVDVDPSEQVSDEGALQNANASLHEYANELTNFLPGVVELPESVGGSVNEIPGSVLVEDVQQSCDPGSISGPSLTGCVACVAGTYFDADEVDCVECPIGTFQDAEGQTGCTACPQGTSTDGTGARNTEECYELCPPGTSSPDGLFGCVRCEVGSYQPLAGQSSCINCTQGLSTPPYGGATDILACTEQCPPGSSSSTGLSPCTPCPRRYYQPEGGQRYCLICEGRKTTASEGSINWSQCIELNHCTGQPCANDGLCISTIQGYFCKCAPGYRGRNCEIDINECESQPCRNGGTCEDLVNGYSCSCPGGFSGPDCSYDIDECEQGPCLNGGKCRDGIADFTCHCQPQYEGDLCERERNPCDAEPCQSGGSCVREGQGYSCLCPSGTTGDDCEITVRACSRDPCMEGDCVDTEAGGFRCQCYQGYEGEHCDAPINYCLQLLCENDGTCVLTREGAACICPIEFAGETCDHRRTICDDEKCLNGAACDLIVLPGQKDDYSCECMAGFTGRHCETDIDECASMPCTGQATCHDLVDGYSCECPAGYEGVHCGVETDECLPSPCAEGSTCVDQLDAYQCLCQPGRTGSECQEDIDYCQTANCTNGATCINGRLAYTCDCPPGYSGVSCEIDINECLPNPCYNQATCVDGIASFSCLCAVGYSGETCQEEINECEDHQCQNGASCLDLVGEYLCECVYGWEGEFCDVMTDFCTSSPCAQGSTCEPIVAGYRCLCLPGFTGEQCQLDINECHSSPCQNNATCVNGIAAYECICTPGHTGMHCGIEVDECLSGPCLNEGSCVDMINGYDCRCPEGFAGMHCEDDIDDCIEHLCMNGGSCIDGIANYTCICTQDWASQFCEDFIPCRGNPCRNGGECFQHQGVRNCSCLVGFHGELCEWNTDDCVHADCQNGGECVDLVNDFYCQCAAGFSGESCEVNDDDCVEEPCRHGGTCVDGLESYTCLCSEGFSGDHCEDVINPCLAFPCQNNGTCFHIATFSVCVCCPGFYGKYCQFQTDECHSSPCLNGGHCSDLINKYTCQCLSAYAGDRCQTRLPGDADLKFHSSPSGDTLKMDVVFDNYDVPFIKIGLWFMATGNTDDFVLFEYTRTDGTEPDLVVRNIMRLTVEMYGQTLYQLEGHDLSDHRWHNLVLTLNARVGYEVALDGGLMVNRSLSPQMENFRLGGDVRMGFVGSADATDSSEVVISGVHLWSYDGGEVSTPCEPREPGDILAWEEILAITVMESPGRTVVAPSICDDDDSCQDHPCSDGSTCVDGADDFSCLCPPGSTGDLCDQVIDPCVEHSCQNGGSCISDALVYSCLCPDNYTGHLCEVPIVYGGWSDWSVWGNCSSDCDGGSQSRERTCDNPAPAYGGGGCGGPATQDQPCNTGDCPSCPPLAGPAHGTINCDLSGLEARCTVDCDEGYSPTSPGPEYYYCGPGTNSIWLNGDSLLETISLPSCVARVRRSAVTAVVQINLPGLTCESAHDQLRIQYQIEDQLDGWRGDIPCLEEGLCDISEVTISECSPVPTYPKFISEPPPSPLVTVHLVQTNPDHNMTSEEGVNDRSLLDSIDVIKRLVTTRGFDLGVSRIRTDNSTISVDGWDVCPPGTIESHREGFCYPCAPGTYHAPSDPSQGHYECEPCPLHSFQSEESSGACIPCPEGLKTKQTGSTSETDCLSGIEDGSFLDMKGWSQFWKIDQGQAILCLIGLVLVVMVTILLYRSLKRKGSLQKVRVEG